MPEKYFTFRVFYFTTFFQSVGKFWLWDDNHRNFFYFCRELII